MLCFYLNVKCYLPLLNPSLRLTRLKLYHHYHRLHHNHPQRRHHQIHYHPPLLRPLPHPHHLQLHLKICF